MASVRRIPGRIHGGRRNNRTEAGFKMASADTLELQAEGLLAEAQKADKVAGRLKDLLEDDE